ncbi:MAG: hypothetical protein RIS52_882, partial [Pseudomonadota bacterium]
MLFAETETQTMLCDMLVKLLDTENGFEAHRARLNATPPDRMALWPHLAQQGVLGAGFSEDAGGFGGTMRDLAVVMGEVGRTLAVEPVLSSILGGRLLGDARAVVAGEQVLALALSEGGFDPLAMPKTQVDAEGRIYGQKVAARHADLAQVLIVSASQNGEAGLWAVEAS